MNAIKRLVTPRNLAIAAGIALVLYVLFRSPKAAAAKNGAQLGGGTSVPDGNGGAGHYQFDGNNGGFTGRVDDPGSDPSLQVTDAAGNVIN